MKGLPQRSPGDCSVSSDKRIFAHCGPCPGLDGCSEAVDPFAPTFHSDRLTDPLHAKKPQVIGVSFLGDLFDPGISDEQLLQVFDILRRNENRDQPHSMILLTKCAARLNSFLRRLRWCGSVPDGLLFLTAEPDDRPTVQLPGVPLNQWGVPELAGHLGRLLAHVWVGVSVTDQPDADERLGLLVGAPARRRWVSVEPMVGPIDLIHGHGTKAEAGRVLAQAADEPHTLLDCPRCQGTGYLQTDPFSVTCPGCGGRQLLVDLVVVGGESGPGARPFDDDWARSLRDQCQSAGVAFYFKQRSGLHPEHEPELDGVRHTALPWE
jgi:protein gp37